jgi:thiamine kinase-like enzyme
VQAFIGGIIPESLGPALDAAYRFLLKTYLGPPVLCHCELSNGNVFHADGRVTALIDWESATGADPAFDVAVFMTAMSSYWYPRQTGPMLAVFVQAYKPDDPENFYRRVIAHQLLFIAGAIAWLRQYGDDYYRQLLSILNDASQVNLMAEHSPSLA